MHCNAALKWKLPDDHTYRVDVIDTWAMTRQTIMESASGIIEIPLSGCENMAVLALAN